MKAILNKLNIDEYLTKPIKKPKRNQFNNVKSIIPEKEDYNFSMDVLILPQATEKIKVGKKEHFLKYIGLLVVVDLATDEFDIEPIISKNPEEILKAFKEITKRKYLNIPKYTVRTDSGKEFEGVVQKYFYDNSILHTSALPGKHTQNANVERLNRELGRLIMGYLNTIENKTGQYSTDWLKIIPIIRKDLNEIRSKKEEIKNIDVKKYIPQVPYNIEPKFKVGDLVHRREYEAINIYNKKDYGAPNRMGDYRYSRLPYRITKILIYPEPVVFRYLLDDPKSNRTSYTEFELLKSKHKERKYFIHRLDDMDRRGKIKTYRVVFKDDKKNPIWMTLEELGLNEDDIKEFVEDLQERRKNKNKKKKKT